MKNILLIKYVVVISIGISVGFLQPMIAFAQAPTPDVWWKFDKSTDDNANNRIKQYNSANTGTRYGSTAYTTDRTGTADKALAFNASNSYVSMPTFFGLGTVPVNVSISCWIRIDNISDTQERFILNARKSNGDKIFGLKFQDKNFSVRKHTGMQESSTTSTWDYPFFYPVQLKTGDATGWYHLTITYDKFYTRVYLRRPGASADICPYPESLKYCQANYVFLGTTSQNWSTFLNSYQLGNDNGYAINAIDDLKLWSRTLTIDEVKALYQDAGSSLVGENGQDLVALRGTNDDFVVYPNPTNGELNVRLQSATEGLATFKVLNLAGKLIYTRQEPLTKGVQELNLGNLKAKGCATGIYLLQVHKPDQVHTVKIVIQ